MKGLIKTILKYILSLIQRFIHKTKVKKLETKMIKLMEIQRESNIKAKKATNDFNKLYSNYKILHGISDDKLSNSKK